jgi:hypothetical protein
LNLIFKPARSETEKKTRFNLWNDISEGSLLTKTNEMYDIFYYTARLDRETPILTVMFQFLDQIRLELCGDPESSSIRWSLFPDINNFLSDLDQKYNSPNKLKIKMYILNKLNNFRLFVDQDLFHKTSNKNFYEKTKNVVVSAMLFPFLLTSFSVPLKLPIQNNITPIEKNSYIVIRYEDIKKSSEIQKKINNESRFRSLSRFPKQVFSKFIDSSTSKIIDVVLNQIPFLSSRSLPTVIQNSPNQEGNSPVPLEGRPRPSVRNSGPSSVAALSLRGIFAGQKSKFVRANPANIPKAVLKSLDAKYTSGYAFSSKNNRLISSSSIPGFDLRLKNGKFPCQRFIFTSALTGLSPFIEKLRAVVPYFSLNLYESFTDSLKASFLLENIELKPLLIVGAPRPNSDFDLNTVDFIFLKKAQQLIESGAIFSAFALWQKPKGKSNFKKAIRRYKYALFI